MALSPIMLTAWAVAEIPGLHIDGYRESSTADVDRVTCRTSEGAVISIASPRTAEAAKVQDREHRVGQLLSAGVRERLGFDVPHTLGAGLLDKRRIVVTEEAQGHPLSAVRDVRPMLPSLALALASLHSLPTTIVKRDAVPVKTALDSVREAAGIIDRAHQTTRVPSALLDRWDAAIEDHEMWQFVPTITHGDLEFASILTAGDDIVGITHWADACVGDPAGDLKNIVGPLAPEVTAGFVADYIAHRSSNDRRVGHRARFLSELEIARWLVFCVDNADEPNVEDAVKMLTNLATAVTDNPSMSLGSTPVKPISLLVEAPSDTTLTAADVVDAPVAFSDDAPAAFSDDAPTMVAEPTHNQFEQPQFDQFQEPSAPDDASSTADESAVDVHPVAAQSLIGGSDYTEETPPIVVDELIVEAFFATDSSETVTDTPPASQDREPRDDEIL